MAEFLPVNHAVYEARRWAADLDFELGRLVRAQHNASQSWWVLVFDFKEDRPQWCYLTCIGDDAGRMKFMAIERPDGYPDFSIIALPPLQ